MSYVKSPGVASPSVKSPYIVQSPRVQSPITTMVVKSPGYVRSTTKRERVVSSSIRIPIEEHIHYRNVLINLVTKIRDPLSIGIKIFGRVHSKKVELWFFETINPIINRKDISVPTELKQLGQLYTQVLGGRNSLLYGGNVEDPSVISSSVGSTTGAIVLKDEGFLKATTKERLFAFANAIYYLYYVVQLIQSIVKSDYSNTIVSVFPSTALMLSVKALINSFEQVVEKYKKLKQTKNILGETERKKAYDFIIAISDLIAYIIFFFVILGITATVYFRPTDIVRLMNEVLEEKKQQYLL